MAIIRDGASPRVPRRKPPKVPVSRRKQGRRPTRRITYNVQAIQSLRNVDMPRRTRLQARAIENKAAIATAYNQNIESMLRFGRRYTTGMAAFNALPGAITALTNRPLQAIVTHGPPALQKFILQGLGPKLGLGAARLADTMIQRWTGPLAVAGLAERFIGGTGAANIPENRPTSGFGRTATQSQQFGFSPPRWGIGR